MALDVSIPCERCSASLRFGQSKCPQCGARPSVDARSALHARLSAASADYRDLQDQINSARTVLLMIGLVYLAVGVARYVVVGQAAGATAADVTLERVALAEQLLTAGAFFFCWLLARERPTLAIAAATLLWIGLHLAIMLVFPLTGLFFGAWLKGVAAILLLRGIVAAVRAYSFQRKLRQTAAL